MIKIDHILENMQKQSHTIHAIVSPLVANDMANVLLSLNQAPFMAEYVREVYDVTKNSNSILVNMGTLNETKLKGIKEGLVSAKKNKVPIILDPVGASASQVRLESSLYYLEYYPISILKANYSEIYSIYHKELTTKGVDSNHIDKEEMIKICQDLSTLYNIIVVATGQEDIICNNDEILILKNGDSKLTKITGTGCLAGGLIAATASFDMSLDAIALGISILNIGAELAEKDKGMATFKLSLLDQISLMDEEKIKEHIKYEKL